MYSREICNVEREPRATRLPSVYRDLTWPYLDFEMLAPVPSSLVESYLQESVLGGGYIDYKVVI